MFFNKNKNLIPKTVRGTKTNHCITVLTNCGTITEVRKIILSMGLNPVEYKIVN